MSTIGQVSGMIAAAAVVVQYTFPAALAIILAYYVGSENTAATWSVVNRTLQGTIWPAIFRSDAVTTRSVRFSVHILTLISGISTVLLVISGVVAPIGLYDVVELGDTVGAEFQYVKDSSPWGRITPPRPDFKFSRYCENGRSLNCPGQYQGTDMVEVPGGLRSVERDKDSTINTTLPVNFTQMFTSATSGYGNTVSGLFDIQYRLYESRQWEPINKGQHFLVGAYRDIENLVLHNAREVKDGLVIDTTETAGIGFRNHTVPIGLPLGARWSEDLTWVEPITKCVDTNLSVEIEVTRTPEKLLENKTLWLVDRGGFKDLKYNELFLIPWHEEQNLDLYTRAYKAARMNNILAAVALNVSLPASSAARRFPLTGKSAGTRYDKIEISRIDGSFLPNVPERKALNARMGTMDRRKGLGLRAENFTAVDQLCAGFWSLGENAIDLRSANLSHAAVSCGYILGAPNERLADGFTQISARKSTFRKIHVCATAMRASIKTVNFEYRGSGAPSLSNLKVQSISPKQYANEQSKPIWQVESSGWKRKMFDPLWGIIDKKWANVTGFNATQASSIWLPACSNHFLGSFGISPSDSLPAPNMFCYALENLFARIKIGDNRRDYSAALDFALYEVFQRISQNATTSARIPNLIYTDTIAAAVVGTKTAITKNFKFGNMAVDGTVRGTPTFQVTRYERKIRYNLLYAIPAFVNLALWITGLVIAIVITVASPSSISTLRQILNQTSTGRLATNLLRISEHDPATDTRSWVKTLGGEMLGFYNLKDPRQEKAPICVDVSAGGPMQTKTRAIVAVSALPTDTDSVASPQPVRTHTEDVSSPTHTVTRSRTFA